MRLFLFQSAGLLRLTHTLQLQEDLDPSEQNLSTLFKTCGWAADVVDSWVEQARPRSKEEIWSKPPPLVNTKTGRKPAHFCKSLNSCRTKI